MEKPRFSLADAKAAVNAVDPLVPIDRFGSLDEMLAASSRERRFQTAILAAFAMISLILALAGVYGTVSFLVRQRQREFGIRLAIGASPRELSRAVLLQVAVWSGIAVIVGLAAARAGAQVLRVLVYGISPHHPQTLLAVAAIVFVASCAAALRPAQRAAAVDPATVLRSAG